MLKKPLRDYQGEAVNSAIVGFEQAIEESGGPFGKQMIVLPTGAGKTVCFAAIADWWITDRQERVLILVDQTDLVDQARDEILEFTTQYPQIEQADRRASPEAKIIVATVQTMAHRLEKFAPENFGLVIADECDRSISPLWQKALNYFDAHAKVLGVTATPDRADQRSVLDYYERIAHEVELFDLIKAGYLTKILVQNIPIKIDISEVKQDAGDYDKEELDAALTPFFGEVCKAIVEHAPERKTLVFLPLIETSKKFVGVARDYGITAAHIDGADSDRETIKQGFKRGDIRLLSNAMLLGRGYNDRSIDCVVNLRPTRSASFYRQCVGRGTRTYCPHGCPQACDHPDAKKNLLLLDFLWTHNRLGLQRPANLVARNSEHAVKLTDYSERQSGAKLDLEGIDSLVAREAELVLLKQLAATAKRRPGFFDAMEVAVALHQRELIEYEPRAKWEEKKPSEKQLAALEAMGFNPESITSRGIASKLFDMVSKRRAQGLCTLKQLRQLRKIKYKDSERVTFIGASAILDNRFSGVPMPEGIKIYADNDADNEPQKKDNVTAVPVLADPVTASVSEEIRTGEARESTTTSRDSLARVERPVSDSRGGGDSSFVSADLAAQRRIRPEGPVRDPCDEDDDAEQRPPKPARPVKPGKAALDDLFARLQTEVAATKQS